MSINMNEEIKKKLFEAAIAVREHAYAPYSNYKVGVALITYSGKIFVGCNIENASYGLTICAERNAIAAAVAAGMKDFSAMLVLTQDDEPGTPCGACRQVIGEFFPQESVIYLANLTGIKKELTVSQLLPFPFKLKK